MPMFDTGAMIIGIIAMIIVAIPQFIVKSTYSKYKQVDAQNGATGADIARAVLADAGVRDVTVEPTDGELSDHYDPSRKVIRLSHDNYYGHSVAAYGVSAHEAGHAIQDFKGYMPMKLRAGIFPAVQAGQMLGPTLIMGGMLLGALFNMGGLAMMIAAIGLIAYASIAVFHLVTLPVEFDASFRAVKALSQGGYISGNEVPNTQKVLIAAALTYVAVALATMLQVLYYAYMIFGRNNNRE